MFQALAQEKEKVLNELEERQTETLRLSKEKESLHSTSETLRQNLKQIEETTQQLLEEKATTEEK